MFVVLNSFVLLFIILLLYTPPIPLQKRGVRSIIQTVIAVVIYFLFFVVSFYLMFKC